MSYQIQDVNKAAIDAAHKSEKDIIISDKSIQRVGCLDLFNDKKLNEAIQKHCKWLLKRQMDNNSVEGYLDFDTGTVQTRPLRYAEIVMLMSTVKPYSNLRVCYGDHCHVEFDAKLKELLALSKENKLITIHNHPFGGGLSWVDICTFIKSDSVISSIVVTNHGRVFQLTKMTWFNQDAAVRTLDSIETSNPMSKSVQSYSVEYFRIQQKRTATIENMLYSLGLVYLTIG